MKIRPLHDRIIVKRMEEERKTASGIVIPDSATENQTKAKYWLSAMARSAMTAKCLHWMYRLATAYCSANMPAKP